MGLILRNAVQQYDTTVSQSLRHLSSTGTDLKPWTATYAHA